MVLSSHRCLLIYFAYAAVTAANGLASYLQ